MKGNFNFFTKYNLFSAFLQDAARPSSFIPPLMGLRMQLLQVKFAKKPVPTEMHRIAPSCTELHRVAEPHYSYSYIVTLPKYYSI